MHHRTHTSKIQISLQSGIDPNLPSQSCIDPNLPTITEPARRSARISDQEANTGWQNLYCCWPHGGNTIAPTRFVEAEGTGIPASCSCTFTFSSVSFCSIKRARVSFSDLMLHSILIPCCRRRRRAPSMLSMVTFSAVTPCDSPQDGDTAPRSPFLGDKHVHEMSMRARVRPSTQNRPRSDAETYGRLSPIAPCLRFHHCALLGLHQMRVPLRSEPLVKRDLSCPYTGRITTYRASYPEKRGTRATIS
jgi:hypothetical protein